MSKSKELIEFFRTKTSIQSNMSWESFLPIISKIEDVGLKDRKIFSKILSSKNSCKFRKTQTKNKWNEIARELFIYSKGEYFRQGKHCRERFYKLKSGKG